MKPFCVLLWKTSAACCKISVSRLTFSRAFHLFLKNPILFYEQTKIFSFRSFSNSSINSVTVLSRSKSATKVRSYKSCSEINELHKSEQTHYFDILYSNGIKEEVIRRYSDLIRNHFTQDKVQYLKQIEENLEDILPLLVLPPVTLRKAAKRSEEDKKLITDFKSRLLYLQHHLELSMKELVNLLMKHTILLTMPFSRLDTKITILKNAKISAEDIVKDPWIFRYTEKLLSERVEAAQSAGFPVKPWLLRCSKKYFNVWLSNSKETKNILLNGEDRISYLARRLNCTEKYVHYMEERNVNLPGINVRKLEKIIDFLYEKGYSTEEIRLFPHVFCTSIKSLKKRFEEFESVKGTKATLPQISLLSNFKKSMPKSKNTDITSNKSSISKNVMSP